MGQHEQDDLTTGMTLQMVQLNTLGQLERGHLERGVINVAPIKSPREWYHWIGIGWNIPRYSFLNF
jgi:hypothetical protein